MAETTHTAWRRERFREQRDPFFSVFCSIRRPYITFKLPHNFSDIRRLGCVTSAHLEWPVWLSSSGNNCHAVHRSLSSGASLKWDLHLVPYYQPSTPARFLLIIGHWDVSLPPSSKLQVWSSSSGNNYHAVHRSISSSASFFYGTVRIFTLSHIVSQAVFYKFTCILFLLLEYICFSIYLFVFPVSFFCQHHDNKVSEIFQRKEEHPLFYTLV